VFVSDEREPQASLSDCIDTGEYHLWVSERRDEVIGFYILSIYPERNYALLCYLAVASNWQGQGIGRELCRHAMAAVHPATVHPATVDPAIVDSVATQPVVNVKWLLVEAHRRQALYYGQLGFLKLQYPYLSPSFDSNESIPMSLMAISVNNQAKHIEIKELNGIVEHIFTAGYQLEPSDKRLTQQLSCTHTTIDLIAWP